MTQSGSRRDRPSLSSQQPSHFNYAPPHALGDTPSASTMTSSMEDQVRYLVDLIMSGWQQTACKCRSGQVSTFFQALVHLHNGPEEARALRIERQHRRSEEAFDQSREEGRCRSALSTAHVPPREHVFRFEASKCPTLVPQ